MSTARNTEEQEPKEAGEKKRMSCGENERIDSATTQDTDCMTANDQGFPTPPMAVNNNSIPGGGKTCQCSGGSPNANETDENEPKNVSVRNYNNAPNNTSNPSKDKQSRPINQIQKCQCSEPLAKYKKPPVTTVTEDTCKCSAPKPTEDKIPATAEKPKRTSIRVPGPVMVEACTCCGPDAEKQSFKQQTNNSNVKIQDGCKCKQDNKQTATQVPPAEQPKQCACQLTSSCSLPILTNQAASVQTSVGKPKPDVPHEEESECCVSTVSNSSPDLNNMKTTQEYLPSKCACAGGGPQKQQAAVRPINKCGCSSNNNGNETQANKMSTSSNGTTQQQPPRLCLCKEVAGGVFCVPGSSVSLPETASSAKKTNEPKKQCQCSTGTDTAEDDRPDKTEPSNKQCSISPSNKYVTQSSNTESRHTQKDALFNIIERLSTVMPVQDLDTTSCCRGGQYRCAWATQQNSKHEGWTSVIADCLTSYGRLSGLRGGSPTQCTCPPGQCKTDCAKLIEQQASQMASAQPSMATNQASTHPPSAAPGSMGQQPSYGTAPPCGCPAPDCKRKGLDAAAGAVPGTVPGSMPASGPASVHGSMPGSAPPGSAPGTVPGSVPGLPPVQEHPTSSCTCPDATPCKPKCQERKEAARLYAEQTGGQSAVGSQHQSALGSRQASAIASQQQSQMGSQQQQQNVVASQQASILASQQAAAEGGQPDPCYCPKKFCHPACRDPTLQAADPKDCAENNAAFCDPNQQQAMASQHPSCICPPTDCKTDAAPTGPDSCICPTTECLDPNAIGVSAPGTAPGSMPVSAQGSRRASTGQAPGQCANVTGVCESYSPDGGSKNPSAQVTYSQGGGAPPPAQDEGAPPQVTGCINDPTKPCANPVRVGCLQDSNRSCNVQANMQSGQGTAVPSVHGSMQPQDDPNAQCKCTAMKCIKSACEMKKRALLAKMNPDGTSMQGSQPASVHGTQPGSMAGTQPGSAYAPGGVPGQKNVIPPNPELLTNEELKGILKGAPPSKCKCVGPCNAQCDRIKELRKEILASGVTSCNSVVGSNANPKDSSTQIDPKMKSNCTCSTVECKQKPEN